MRARILTIGVETPYSCNLRNDLETAIRDGYDFILTPLVHPLFIRDSEYFKKEKLDNNQPLTRSDLILSSNEWRTRVLGQISNWIVPESPDPNTRQLAKLVLQQEVTFASYLGLYAVLLPSCFDALPIHYSHMISSLVQNVPKLKFLMRMPVKMPQKNSLLGDCDMSSWQFWNAFRTYCSYSDQIEVALELTEGARLSELNIWFAEPLSAILIPTHIFSLDEKNNLFMPAVYLEFLIKCAKFHINLIILGNSLHEPFNSTSKYNQYLKEHCVKAVDECDPLLSYVSFYDDYLQSPLHPLYENLESSTYEVFERDLKKYQLYEDAITAAIKDQVKLLKSQENKKHLADDFKIRFEDETKHNLNDDQTTDDNTDSNLKFEKNTSIRPLTLFVIGAGRGPLVEAAMRASIRSNHKLVLYALEKNSHAFNTLANKKLDDCRWSEVNVINVDVRYWKFDGEADIIVSEMLGSFGDNELSPECIQSVQHKLRPHGVLIPQEYSSYVAPISSSKLWTTLNSMCNPRVFETLYIVRLGRHLLLDRPLKNFKFVHPDCSFSSNRQKTHTFEMEHDCVCHGFAGYFNCVLYGNVILSTLPETHTKELYSWFPTYFPIKIPLLLSRGSKLVVHFERCRDMDKIWYEWCVLKPIHNSISNSNGKSNVLLL